MVARRSAKPAGAPSWVGEDLVGCVDGPLGGQWFTRRDWDARIRSANLMVEKQQRPGACLFYEPGKTIDHPHQAGASGQAMTYRPPA